LVNFASFIWIHDWHVSQYVLCQTFETSLKPRRRLFIPFDRIRSLLLSPNPSARVARDHRAVAAAECSPRRTARRTIALLSVGGAGMVLCAD
jgi:hypothetical protein